jgi:flagellin
MALGVLNNLSAIYAENNLNNTNNSLQTVLQQLSSGSKINSGADDAAGLSLVNGLQANASALMQSETNATEGVGLLQVADGALSQVTNLLDRAVTLATESSNGTLNSTQLAAANQEYQSILAEVNNIGSTTTYNQVQVFDGTTVAIYTGDSSTAGSSVDDLNIRGMSSASLGDTGGVMSYSSGQDNVFINLSKAGVNAGVSDSLSGTSNTITVNYLTQGAGGAAVTATANISVGAGTNYANTAQGLIGAINAAGLGLNATFTTSAQAGTASSSAGIGTQTGILISGQSVGTGTLAGVVGTLTLSGAVSGATDTMGGTLDIGTNTITLGTANSTDTLANLENTINSGNYGVTAAVSGSKLTLTSGNPAIAISSTGMVDSTTGNELGTLTDSNVADTLTGTFDIMGSDGTTHSFVLSAGNNNNTLAKLAAYITAQGWGINATAPGTTMTMTSTTSGSQASFNASDVLNSVVSAGTLAVLTGPGVLTLANVPAPLAQMTTTARTIGTMTIGGLGTSGDVLSGTLDITGANGLVDAITVSAGNANNTLATLAAYLTAQNIGITATVNSTGNGQVLTIASTSGDSQASFSAASITGVADATAGSTLTVGNVKTPPVAYSSAAISGSVTDSSTSGGSLVTGLISNTNGTTGIATITYSDGAGQNLSSTDLLSQTDSQLALTDINVAISDVSSLDGYVGAQINTLNSVSQVMSTQQENVVSAQNAVQATDYASATSNMSKYEILSQTGIAALAQANSVQQEVTKLLQ